jgi:CubicO group peptidase (beta-lactamase class C family)
MVQYRTGNLEEHNRKRIIMTHIKIVCSGLYFLLVLILGINVSGYGGEIQSRDNFLAKGKYQGEYWPTTDWRSCRPEEVGMDSNKLLEVYDYVADPGMFSRGIVIIRKGYIIGESYFGGDSQHTRFESYSMAKSFMSALIGIAIDQEMLQSVDTPIYNYYPELLQKKGFRVRGDILDESVSTAAETAFVILPQSDKKRIKTEHVLQMTSGLEWNESEVDLMSDVPQMILSKPLTHEPGTYWRYSSGDSMLLSGIIDRTTGRTAYEFGYDNLFLPIGMHGISWESDPAGHTIGGWGIDATVREFAKFGHLYLNKGWWDGEQIVSETWVEESVRPVSEEIDFYGYQWWLVPDSEGNSGSIVPDDVFYAQGLLNQNIFIIPGEDIVIVRTASDLLSEKWSRMEFLTLVMESILY